MSEYKKTALVLGAGGFIGSHMVKRLRSEGYWVRGVDLKYPEFGETEANEFIIGDLRSPGFVNSILEYKGEQGNYYRSVPYQHILPFDEIYQFAATWVVLVSFSLVRTMQTSYNSVTINLNVLEGVRQLNETFDGVEKEYTVCNRPKLDQPTKIFYSGSACMYPEHNQLDPDNPDCREESKHTQANPDSEYGWEKLLL